MRRNLRSWSKRYKQASFGRVTPSPYQGRWIATDLCQVSMVLRAKLSM